MTMIGWYQNANDSQPIFTEFHPEHPWPGGRGIVGRVQYRLDIDFFKRYGIPNPDGASRFMQGWGGEPMGGTAHEIVKALKGGGEVSYQELFDLLATEAKGPEPMSAADYRRLVGRPDPDSAPGSQEEGAAQHNPIWLKATDPRVSANRYHGDTWTGPNGRWYGLDDKSRPRPIIKQPLGTGESGGGETVPTPEQTLSVEGRFEQLERLLAELRAMLRTGNP